MYNCKIKELSNPFKMRKGETIVDIEKYVEMLKRHNIVFTDEQYKNAIKEMENCRLFDIDYFNTLSKTNNRIKKTKALSAAEYVKSWTDEIIKELCFRDIIWQ